MIHSIICSLSEFEELEAVKVNQSNEKECEKMYVLKTKLLIWLYSFRGDEGKSEPNFLI